MNTIRQFLIVLALCFGIGASSYAQLNYTSDTATIAPFTAMKADTAFVNNTLLNLGTFAPMPDFDGQLHSFSFGGLTFNNIPNLDPASPSDIQVGAGFTADVLFLASDHSDTDNLGAESSLLGASNQTLYPGFGPSSTLSWHISAPVATDLVFWMQDASIFGTTKFTMDDVLHFTTFTAVDLNFRYYIFGIDDRGVSSPGLQDYDDGVFGVRLNLVPVGLEAVPEPSTYGIVAGACLLGLVAWRRASRKAQAV